MKVGKIKCEVKKESKVQNLQHSTDSVLHIYKSFAKTDTQSNEKRRRRTQIKDPDSFFVLSFVSPFWFYFEKRLLRAKALPISQFITKQPQLHKLYFSLARAWLQIIIYRSEEILALSFPRTCQTKFSIKPS